MNGIDSKVIYVLATIYMYIQWPIIRKKKKKREKKKYQDLHAQCIRKIINIEQ